MFNEKRFARSHTEFTENTEAARWFFFGVLLEGAQALESLAGCERGVVSGEREDSLSV